MADFTNEKGQFIKGYKMADIPVEHLIKKMYSMEESWKKRKDYIRDIVKDNPRIYNVWRGIKFTENGKKVGNSEEWDNYRTFYNDVIGSYSVGKLFRRLDTSKPYSKENFMWVTQIEAEMLRSDLIWIEYKGSKYTLKQLSDLCNVSFGGLRIRYHNRIKKNYTLDEIIYGRRKNRASKRPKDYKDSVNIRAKASKMISSYRNKDIKNGVPICDIGIDWMIANILKAECVYCGDIKRVGCDRLINSKGHTKDNVVPCCIECNMARNANFTFDEMKVIGKAISKVKKARNKS